MSFYTLNSTELNGGEYALRDTTLDVLETAVVTNPEPEWFLSDDVYETAEANDYAYDTRETTTDVLETAGGGDAAYPTVSETLDVTETAEANDYVSHEYPNHDVLETAEANDYATLTAESTLDLSETAEANDYAWPGDLVDVLDLFEANDYVTADATSTLDVLETAVANDAYDFPADEIWDVLETATLDDFAWLDVEAISDLHEDGFISDAYYADEETDHLPIYTANVVNWAMSQYDGLQFSGMVDNYAVAPDGLYEKGAGYANIDMKTGKTNLGSPNLKAMQYAYVYSEHASPMTIGVTADVNGVEATYSYTQMARDASDTRAVRCTFGRGFRSNYYQLELTSTGYARVHSVVPLPDELTRRI